MSYINKGSISVTVMVSREPDRSGNWVCDGTADDVQIQATLAYLNALGGGKLYIGEGTYNFAAGVTIYDDITIEGAGREITILSENAAVSAHILSGTTIDAFEMRNLTLDQNGASQAQYNCFRIGTPTNIVFENVAFNEGFDYNLHLVSGSELTVVDCYFLNGEGHGCVVGGNNIFIANCYSYNNGGQGFGTGGYDLIYDTCIAMGNGTTNFNIEGGSIHDITVIGCIGNDAVANHGIRVIDSTTTALRINVINCTFENNGDNGIACYDVNYSMISGNVCNNNGVHGIYIFRRTGGNGCLYNMITNNMCCGNTEQGIVEGDGDYNYIKNNRLYNNTAGVATINGVNTILNTIVFPFVMGGNAAGVQTGQFSYNAADPKGWQIDATDEWAIAIGYLPPEVQMVAKIRISAVALGAPIGAGGQMHIGLVVFAGPDDADYETEGIGKSNWDSVTVDYIADDVIHWRLVPADDVDLDDMVGGMSIELKVEYDPGVDPDGATNAVLRAFAIDYV